MSGQARRDEKPLGPSLRSLPAVDSDLDEPITASSSEALRLLLVEKDEAMRVMLGKMLSSRYHVEAVSDGLEACQAARLHPPALIIIDLYIPGTDNLTLIRAMRAEPRTAHLPIIILTASMNKEPLLRCLAAGASNFLLKPFNTAELLMCTRVELQLRGPHAEPDR